LEDGSDFDFRGLDYSGDWFELCLCVVFAGGVGCKGRLEQDK